MHPITHVSHPDLYIVMAVCPITHVSHCPCASLIMWPIAHVPPLPYSHVDLEGSCCIFHMPHHSCSPSPMCPITLPLLLMWPIAHVAYCPCTLSPMSPIQIFTLLWQCAPSLMCPIVHVPHCSCAPSPMCPIPQGAPSLSSVLTRIPICPHGPLPICQKRCKVVKKMSICQKDVKLSKRCQVVKKMSNVKKSNTWTMEEVHKKMSLHEAHTYWYQFWCHIWWLPKTLKMCIESVFEPFWWPSYLTSKLTSICVNLIMWINFFVNLLHSLCVSLFDIWHLFDILTSFWHFDIFFNLNHLSPSQGYFWKNALHSPTKLIPVCGKFALG